MNFRGNWVDLIIVAICIYFIFDSWKVGFWIILIDFLSFFLSLLVALSGFSIFAGFLQDAFSLPNSVANALGFFLMAGLSQAFLSFALAELVKKVPYKFWKKPWNNIAGIIPSTGQGLILTAFMLTLVMSLPVSPVVKKDVSESKIGAFLIQNTTGIEARLKDVFGGLAEDALTYLTVTPGSHDSVRIPFDLASLSEDQVSEKAMFALVNEERRKRGITQLTWREELAPVARAYANDMWKRQYFSHYSPEGESVADRLKKANISFQVVGENLALAPTLQTAHTGLMGSEGHRKNILDPDYERMGIGVIDDGIYGKMFVQIFTD